MKSFKSFLKESSEVKVHLPKSVQRELEALEYETVDDHSPGAKKKFVDAFTKKKGDKISLDDEEANYLLNDALTNAVDILNSQGGKKRTVNSLRKVARQLVDMGYEVKKPIDKKILDL